MPTTIQVEERITVGNLSEKIDVPVGRLIAELMKNGVMATVNEQIDIDTAQIIVSELGLDVELTKKDEASKPIRDKKAGANTGEPRPPVVAFMGHVDHGKTSLLDAIRKAEVAKGEAGGITQYISAYQVTHNDRLLTLLDTPGHEAFGALREHGAQLTDLVVIVVAADDGVKPQTIEAIRFAKKAGVKMIVAINKIDKEGADSSRIKQQLAEQDLLIEEWGGDIVVVEVSAKTGKGIDQLLDLIFLVADVEDLRAERSLPAHGLIIEAHMEQGRGPVAIALVEQGTLKSGDIVLAGSTYARIRNLETTSGKSVKEALPSTPVVITGFKQLPEFADEFEVVTSEKLARTRASSMQTDRQSSGTRVDLTGNELMRIIDRKNQVQELNIVLKADVQGSLTSVIDSLKSLNTDEVAVRVVGSGVGTINENDVHLAATTHSIIYGFNISLPSNVKQLSNRDKVPVRLYKIIYELIDDAREELTKLLAPEIIETSLGQLEVKGIFKTTKTETICGGEVLNGKLSVPALARLTRGDDIIGEVEVTGLRRGTQEAKEVIAGEMCGLSLKSKAKLDVQEGDKIEFLKRESVARTL